ncbi:MAG: BON domain-containing protein [Candidatus Binatus sp.]|uniref:BON domain-containing protein n=1 Tax=Candidatus Binatus sp. TaxID=2811406 RepID=UPI0027289023|nr:BON domain-containing protein [Candidatus Binatus sp.]MDO8433638.1 BON domain-containing protein [Candidatus Binatus sp.]
MKRCPRCDKIYPDSETFCEIDGTALVGSGPAFAPGTGRPTIAMPSEDAGEAPIECPVCGGKAQPGELICNFCGARLSTEPASPPFIEQPPPPSARRVAPAPAQPTPSGRFTGRMPPDEVEGEEGRSALTLAAYALAAIVALGGGAWLALHLSSKKAEQPVAEASPASAVSPGAAATAGAPVSLASAIGVQVTGESAYAPERNQEAVHKFFEEHKDTLNDSYARALSADNSFKDAMILRVKVLPSGAVDGAAVRTSTSPNPSFDADVVKVVLAWTFPRFSGSAVEIDYPVIFNKDPASKDAIESALSTKLASLSPTEAPEYGSSPAVSPPAAPPVAGGGTPRAEETPPVASYEPPPAPTEPRPARRPPRPEVAAKPPPLTLQQRVKQVLASNPKLRRVDCYTSGGTVTIFGKVFNANDKLLAERTVRQVSGVTNVIDSLSTDEGDWARRQDQIAQQLANAGLDKVTIKIIGHDAFIAGSVKTEADKQRAVLITESAAPVQVRTNLITVEPGRVFGF